MPSPTASLERRAGPGKQEGALARMSSLLRGGGLKTGGRPPSPIIEMVTLITMTQTCARCVTMFSPGALHLRRPVHLQLPVAPGGARAGAHLHHAAAAAPRSAGW